MPTNLHLKTNGPSFVGPFDLHKKFPALKVDLCPQLHDARISRARHLAKSARAERGVQCRIVGLVESVERLQPEL